MCPNRIVNPWKCLDVAAILSAFVSIFCSMCIPIGYLLIFKEFLQWILRFKKLDMLIVFKLHIFFTISKVPYIICLTDISTDFCI